MLFIKKICKEKIKNYIGKIISSFYKKKQKLYILFLERLDENYSYLLRIKNEKEPIIIYNELLQDTIKILKGVLI